MLYETSKAMVNAHISCDRLINALDSISSKNAEELTVFKNLLENQISEIPTNESDSLKTILLYSVLEKVRQKLYQKGLD